MSTDNPMNLVAEALKIEDPADRLIACREAESLLELALAEARSGRKTAIAELRERKVTWRAIGSLLGGIPANAAEQLG